MSTNENTPVLVDGLRELLAKATPGPWAMNPVVAQVDAMPSLLPVCRMLWPTEDRSEAETEANARLIATMRDALPALLARLDSLAGERDALAAELARLREAVIGAVPMNWCDSLLTGPEGIGEPPYMCPDIESLLRGIRARIAALAAKPEGTNKEPTK
jgi:hypothetical protein